MTNKLQFDAERWLRSQASLYRACHNRDLAENFTMCAEDVARMKEELAALKEADNDADAELKMLRDEVFALTEAARPVAEWWEGLKRNTTWNGEKVLPEMVAMPSHWDGQPIVRVEQLDALAALVEEE